MRRSRALSQLCALLSGRTVRTPDWEAILALAGEQLIVPQLHDRLRACGQNAPADVWSYLREARERTIARNERLFATLRDALATLNAAGVEPVLLKGGALWAAAPGAALAPPQSDRLVADLDLLVRPEEMPGALEALAAAGFTIFEDHRATAQHDVVVLGRERDVGAIDLHQHAPTLRSIADVDDLHGASHSVAVAGGRARVPSVEAQLLLMALHDQLHDARFWHGGFDLRHLLDIAALAKGGVDWRSLAASCRTSTARAALAVQLEAARRVAGAQIPREARGGVWSALHFWRQRAQFAWPWLNQLFSRIRRGRFAGGVQRALWRTAVNLAAGGARRAPG